MSGVDWQLWARQVSLRSMTEKMTLNELALLCDANGSCVVSVDHLARHTGRGRRQIFNVLDRLESKGLIKREKRVSVQGRQKASRITLLENTEARLNTLPVEETELTLPDSLPDANDEAGLRELLNVCIDSGWAKLPSQMLAETIASSGNRMIKSITNSRLDDDASFEDTLSRAFELCKKYAESIAQATYPWGLLKTVVVRGCLSQYKIDRKRIETCEDLHSWNSYVEPISTVGDKLTKFAFDSQTVENVLAPITKEFVSRGMDETVVQAVHKILLEVAASYGHTRRHTKAGSHPVLTLLVPSIDARRLWMSVLVGTRRSPWGAEADKKLQEQMINKIVALTKNS